MDNAFLQLSFLVQNNPGVYSLLLGAGISYTSGIPTAWDIVLDLIRKLALLQGENAPENPEKWYWDRFGKVPDYSDILEALAPTALERNLIIQQYFEPTADEREANKKLPTQAHRSIAALIKDGYIRVVLTTNFDRLLETALAELGITPDVVSSADMAQGALPLEHSKITIIKLHGDYRDARSMNTAQELDEYDPAINLLLDRILDSYGVIVCGWSAIWDTALRSAIQRASNRRFSTFWISPHEVSDVAKGLIAFRHAQVLRMDADDFFGSLASTVQALAKGNRDHPLSIAVAVERTKKLIPIPSARIELEELVLGQVEHARKSITNYEMVTPPPDFPIQNKTALEIIGPMCQGYFDSTELTLNVMAALAWFGEPQQSHLVTSAISRWAIASTDSKWRELYWQYMPSVLLLYTCGIAGLCNQNWTFLPAILLKPKVLLKPENTYSSVLAALGDRLFLAYARGFSQRGLAGGISAYLEEQLRSVLGQYLTNQSQYENAFDLFEMVLSLVYLDTIKSTWTLFHPSLVASRSHPYLLEYWSSELPDKLLNQAGLFGNDRMRLYNRLKDYQAYAQALRKEAYHFAATMPDFATIYGTAYNLI